jgi:hypothetical protein
MLSPERFSAPAETAMWGGVLARANAQQQQADQQIAGNWERERGLMKGKHDVSI